MTTPTNAPTGANALALPITWRGQPGARLHASLYTVLDCAVVRPFFVDVIRQDEPETPEAPFLWSVSRLLENGFIVRGDEATLSAAKAAAEEAARAAMAVEPCEPVPADPETSAPATCTAAVEAFQDGWAVALEAWGDYSNDDRLEANTAVLAERFRLAVAAAGPLTSMDVRRHVKLPPWRQEELPPLREGDLRDEELERGYSAGH